MKSVQQQLLDYLKSNKGTFASGDLQRLEWRNRDGTLAVPRTVVRRLQELAEEGLIHCDMRGNHAHYSAEYVPPSPKYRMQVVETASGPVAKMVLA